jgi:hypothetical protein
MTRWIALMLVLSWGLASPGDAWAGSHAGTKGGPVAAAASVEQAAASLMPAAVHHRLMIVGEVHGTNETPALVASLVCHTAASHPVRLGLEMPDEMEGALRDYLRSAGSGKDKAALLQQPFWSSQDGRSSAAMFELIEAVRVLRAQGRDADVFAMEPVYPGEADAAKAGGYLKVKEDGMVAAIRREMEKAVPHQLVIALMGNYHARDSRLTRFQGTPDGSVTERLGALSPYVVLPFAVHLQAWNCTAEGCGVHASESSGAPAGRLPRLLPQLESSGGPTVVELWLARFTASYPAGKKST